MRMAVPALLWLSCALPASSHEFWLQPDRAVVAPDQRVDVRIYIGSDFLGEELANFPSLQHTVDLFAQGQRYKIGGRIGDLPAFSFQPQGEGLQVLRYQSVDNVVIYDSYAAYLTFLQEAQRTDLAAAHDARGLSRDGITEAFTRFAKGLIAARPDGKPLQGDDLFTGMPFELVAVENPYRREGDAVTFALLLGGEPAPDAALHLFIRRPDGSVDATTRLRSDAKGLVEVPSRQPGFYMLNAIHIQLASEPVAAALGASWHSLWASSTFEIR